MNEIVVVVESVEGGYIATMHKKGKPYEQTKAIFTNLVDAIEWINRAEYSVDYVLENTSNRKDTKVDINESHPSLDTGIAIALDLPYNKPYSTDPTYMLHVLEALAERKITVSILQEPYRKNIGGTENKGYLPYYTVTLWSGLCGFSDQMSKTHGTSPGRMICAMAIDILNKIKDKEKKCQ